MTTLKEFLKTDRFATCTGVELLEIKPGYARARMEVTDRHLNGGGVCQGGALFTLADLAFAAVANSRKKLTLSRMPISLFSVPPNWVTCMPMLLRCSIIIAFLLSR